MKITTRKPANLVDFFQKITAAHHPEAACSIVALAHKTDANFSRNLQIFFGMHKFLQILSLGGENHSQKTSKPGGFFLHENHFLWRGKPVGTMKSDKKLQTFPKIYKNFSKNRNF